MLGIILPAFIESRTNTSITLEYFTTLHEVFVIFTLNHRWAINFPGEYVKPPWAELVQPELPFDDHSQSYIKLLSAPVALVLVSAFGEVL